MEKIMLLIKAETFQQAKSAAAQRGIHITDLCAMSKAEFRARTHEKNLLPVQRWYNEAGNFHSGFGYEIGTLLYFNLN